MISGIQVGIGKIYSSCSSIDSSETHTVRTIIINDPLIFANCFGQGCWIILPS